MWFMMPCVFARTIWLAIELVMLTGRIAFSFAGWSATIIACMAVGRSLAAFFTHSAHVRLYPKVVLWLAAIERPNAQPSGKRRTPSEARVALGRVQIIFIGCSLWPIGQVLAGALTIASRVYVFGAKGHAGELAQLLCHNATHQLPQLLDAGWHIRVIASLREMAGVHSL